MKQQYFHWGRRCLSGVEWQTSETNLLVSYLTSIQRQKGLSIFSAFYLNCVHWWGLIVHPKAFEVKSRLGKGCHSTKLSGLLDGKKKDTENQSTCQHCHQPPWFSSRDMLWYSSPSNSEAILCFLGSFGWVFSEQYQFVHALCADCRFPSEERRWNS